METQEGYKGQFKAFFEAFFKALFTATFKATFKCLAKVIPFFSVIEISVLGTHFSSFYNGQALISVVL